MKKLTAYILSLIMVVTTGIPIYAKENAVWEYEILSDNTAKIVGYTSKSKIVFVPQKVDGYTVTEIGSTAFYNSDIEKITLPNSVESISWWAFYGCHKLAEVNLNDGLNSIAHGAFMNCKNLKSITLPTTLCKIDEDAFAVNCKTKKGVKDKFSDGLVSSQNYTTTDNFQIIGYGGTVSELYAHNNNLRFVSNGNILFGDINFDGLVDENDIVLLENYINGDEQLSADRLLSADVDGDAEITQKDIDYINLYTKDIILYSDFPVTKEFKSYRDYFSGKSMYCEGDSVALGLGTNTFGSDYYSFGNFVSEQTGMFSVNTAVSGTTLAIQDEKIGTKKRSILERIREADSEYDVVLLDGGFNDLFQKIEIGEITPVEDKSGMYDEYTTAGALESICYILNTKYEDSIKLFVLCHTMIEKENQSMYWDTIRTILEKWDIPYVDISQETEFCNINDEISTQYFKYNEKKKKGDGVHPLKYAAQKVYGPRVVDKLYELVYEREKYEFPSKVVELGIAEQFQQLPTIQSNEILTTLRWSSGNPSVAVVDENGIVTPHGIGTTTIRTVAADGKKSEYTVEVKYMAMDMKLDRTELYLNKGESMLLRASTLYNTASYHKNFTSSDESVVTVTSESGVVTAVGEGSAVVTCKSVNGVKIECIVTVTDTFCIIELSV